MGYIERFEHAFLALREQRPPCRSLAFTEAGLVLGAGTFVAPMRRGGGDAAALDLSGEDRILALLAAAFSAPVDAAVLAKLRHAAELWAQGDKLPRANSSGASAPAETRKRGTGVSGSSSPIV